MAEITSIVKSIDSSSIHSDASDTSSTPSGSPRSSSPIIGWTIKYKTNPKKVQPKGIWGGYETKEEFMTMHFR